MWCLSVDTGFSPDHNRLLKWTVISLLIGCDLTLVFHNRARWNFLDWKWLGSWRSWTSLTNFEGVYVIRGFPASACWHATISYSFYEAPIFWKYFISSSFMTASLPASHISVFFVLGVIHLWRPQENEFFYPSPVHPHEADPSCGRPHAVDLKYTSLSWSSYIGLQWPSGIIAEIRQ